MVSSPGSGRIEESGQRRLPWFLTTVHIRDQAAKVEIVLALGLREP